MSYITQAVQQAEKSWHSNFRHGAVLIQGRSLLSTGYNKPLISNKVFKSIHAEMSAIKNAKCMKCTKRQKNINLIMYVVRINKSGNLCSSKPCNKCQSIMKTFGVHSCYYSTKQGGVDVIVL